MVNNIVPSPDLTFRAPTFRQIADVEATEDGEVLVMDKATREVTVLDYHGHSLGRLAVPESSTLGLGEFLAHVLIASRERILVPDIANDRALVFDKRSRAMVKEIGLPRHAGFANHWTTTRAGQVYVSTVPVPVHRFLREPEHILSHLSKVSGLFRPSLTINLMISDGLKPVVRLEGRRNPIPVFSPGIIWDAFSDGRIVVADGHRRVLVSYSPEGELLEERSIPLEPSMISAAERAWLLKRCMEAVGLGEPPSFISADRDGVGPIFTALRVDDHDRIWLRKPASIASLHEASTEAFPEVLLRGSSQWVVLSTAGSDPIEITFPSDLELTRVRRAFAYGFRFLGSDKGIPVRFQLNQPLR